MTDHTAQNAISAMGQAVWGEIEPLVNGKLASHKGSVSHIEIKHIDQSTVKVEGTVNKAFHEALPLINAGLNVMFVGPAGYGKTTLARQIAKALKLRYAEMSVSGATTESDLFGRSTPNVSDGSMRFMPSDFLSMYEEGGMFCLDEIDSGNENTFVKINSASGGKCAFVEARKHNGLSSFVKKHENFRLVACANTFGTGGSMIYSGRNQMDAATLDRFITIWVDYCRDLEASLMGDSWCDRVWSIRERVEKNQMRRVVSTRMFFVNAGLMKAAGLSDDKVMRTLLSSWTQDDRVRVGEA